MLVKRWHSLSLKASMWNICNFLWCVSIIQIESSHHVPNKFKVEKSWRCYKSLQILSDCGADVILYSVPN